MTVPAAGVRPETVLRLQQNATQLDRLVLAAETAQADGRPEGAAVLAQLAAHHAWQNPTGALFDARLEALLVTVGRTAVSHATGVTDPATADRTEGDRRHVLHVLTEAYETGGHSRLAWRWIGRDDARASVALTQARTGPPLSLERAVTAAGGRMHDLAALDPTLTGRAAHLRALAADADVVVLHLHPFDVVPVMALAGLPVPVVYVDHADHCFWVGRAVTDVVCDHRRAGQRVTAEKRLVAARHQALLPLPVDVPAVRSEDGRADARRELEAADGDAVAVTVAHEGKTRPLHGPGLADVLEVLAGAHPRFRAVVVGARPNGPAWSAVAERTGGRVRAVGVVADPSALLAAADIYLDSTPVGSLTALLEAVAAGLPPVSLFRFPGLTDVFGSNAPGLGSAHAVEPTVEGFLATMAGLIDDDVRRREQAAAAREQLQAHHSGAAWTEALSALYHRAATAGRIEPIPQTTPAPADFFDALLCDYHAASGMTMDLAALVAHHRPLMGSEVAAATRTDAELAAMIGRSAAQAGGGAVREDGRPPTIVFPLAWPDQPRWLSATFARMALAADPGRVPLRVVLPLADRVGPDLVEAAVAAASAALRDADLDPAALPFDVVIGDDEGVRSAEYPWRRLVLSGTSVPEVGWLRSLQIPHPDQPADDPTRTEAKETPSCPMP